MTCIETCQLEPFVSEVTPQLEDPSSIELFQQQVEGYLTRMREAICNDITCLEEQIIAIEARVTALESP